MENYLRNEEWQLIVKNSSLDKVISSLVNNNNNIMASIGAILNLLNNRRHVEEASTLLDELLPFINPSVLIEFYQDFIVSLLNAEAFNTLARVIYSLPPHLFKEEAVKNALLHLDEEYLIIACRPKSPMLQNTKDDARIQIIKNRKLSLETVVALSSQNCLTKQLSIDLLLPFIQQLQKKHAYSIYQCLRSISASPKQMNLIISNLPTKPGQSICLAGLLNNVNNCHNYSLIVCNLIQGMFEPEKEFLKSILKLIVDPVNDVNLLDNNIVTVLQFVNTNLTNIKYLHCWDFMVLYLARLIITWKREFITTHTNCDCTRCLIKKEIRHCLTILGSLKSTHFPYEKELEVALKAFFSILPIEEISNCFELQQMDWPWFYLSKYPIGSNLEYVVAHILPLHDHFNNYSVQVAAETDKKKFEFLANQVFDVVVQSCTFANNLNQGYTLLGQQFNLLMQSHPKFVSLLFIKLKQSFDKITNEEITMYQADLINQESITSVKSYFSSSMKLVMPMMLNKFLETVDPSTKQHLISAIIAVVPTCPVAVLQSITVPALAQVDSYLLSIDPSSMNQSNNPIINISNVLDICDILAILTKYVRSDDLYATTKQLLVIKDAQLQKRGYRLMEHFIPFVNVNDASLVITQIEQQHCLARKERCKILQTLVENIPESTYLEPPTDAFLKLLSEIIYATKENNEKSRSAALHALNMICINYSKCGKIEIFINIVASGMVNANTTFISASIVALSRAVYAAKNELTTAYLMGIYDALRHYYTVNQKAIIKSIFIFVKVMVNTVDSSELKQVLSGIGADFAWIPDRNKMKQLIQRVLKKLSRTELLQVLPEQYHKMIKNIVKEQRKMENIQLNDDKTVVRFNKEFNEIANDGNSVFTTRTNKSVFDRVTLNDANAMDINEIHLQGKKTKNMESLESMFTTLDGKYVINDMEEEVENDKEVVEEDLVREMMTSNEMGKRKGLSVVFENTHKKRKQEDEEDAKDVLKVKKSKKKKVKFQDTIGKAYRSKKGKGDVKKSGQLDPYAYIPLGK